MDKAFSKLSPQAKEFYDAQKEKAPNERTYVVINDHFLGKSEEIIRDHCVRGYQNQHRDIILASAHLDREIPPPMDIPFREHVKVMGPVQYADFYGYQGKIREEFFEIVQLAKNATWKNDGSLEKLREYAQESRDKLNSSLSYKQKDLENFLRSKNKVKKVLSYDSE